MKKFKLPLLFVLLGAFAGTLYAQVSITGANPAGSIVARHGQLRVGGNNTAGFRIVDQHGEPFQLRGMSFFWNTPNWEGARFYTAGAVNQLVDHWGSNVVRVAVAPGHVDLNNANSPYRNVIRRAIERGIYVVVDFHTHSHNDQAAAITFFNRMVDDYGQYPNMLWEIFNEPCPLRPGDPNFGSCSGDNWAIQIRPYSVALVNAIRNRNNNQHIIIIGTPDFSKRVDEAALNPVPGTNLVYAVHYYTAEPGTNHQQGLRDWSRQALEGLGGRQKLALLVTEFGVSEADGGQGTSNKPCNTHFSNVQAASGLWPCSNSNATYNNRNIIDTVEANRWFDFLDEFQIGWMNWSIVDKNEASAALTGSAAADGSNWTNALTNSGRYIRNKLIAYNAARTLTVAVNAEGCTGCSVARVRFDGVEVAGNPHNTTHNHGVHIRLVPKPAEGWEFVSWGGDAAGTGGNLVMTANRSVTATFRLGGNIITENPASRWRVQNRAFPPPPLTGTFAENTATGSIALSFTNTAQPGTLLEHAFLFRGGNSLTDGGLPIASGRRYRLSFDARSEQPREINVAVGRNLAPDVKYLNAVANFGSPISLTQTNQSFQVEFDIVTANGQALVDGQVEFWFGGNNTVWHLSNVRLANIGPATGAAPSPSWSITSIQQSVPAAAAKTTWSAVRTAGGVQLSGPTLGGEARVSLYDVRGRLVKRVPFKSGQVLTLNKNVAPAGNYLLVVRNSLGKEVYKTRVSLVN